MSKPYDHHLLEFALAAHFPDPTKTCGSRWEDGKTLVYSEDEAWMTDEKNVAHLGKHGVTTHSAPDTEVSQDWLKIMTDAVRSMQDGSHLNYDVNTPRYPNVSSNFRYLENSEPVATDNLFRIGERQVKTTVPGDGYVHVDTVRDLTYTDTGFQVNGGPTLMGTILQSIGL